MTNLERSPLTTAAAGRYIIGSKIGNGSYTEVYEAKDRELKRSIAIKLLKRELRGDSSILERFISMAHVTAEIQHPHVIAVFDIGETEPFMTMPVIESGDIVACRRRRQQQNKPFGTGEIIYILYGISHALLTAHRKGFVHANLSPKNILLTDGALPIVTDFALDRRKGGVFHKSLASSDTFPYLSIEQWDGKEVNPTTDQYSLALVIYFLLAGKHPPRSTRKDGGMQELITPDLFLNCSPSIARKLVDLLRRCLHEEASQRFPSMLSIVSELDSIKERAFRTVEKRVKKSDPTALSYPQKELAVPTISIASPTSDQTIPKVPISEPAKSALPFVAPPTASPEQSPTPVPEDPDRLFATAKELIRNREFEPALGILNRLKNIGFQSPVVQSLTREAGKQLRYQKKVEQLIQESFTELKAGNLEKAEQKLSAALQLERNNDRVKGLLEKVKNLRGKRDAAKEEVIADQTIALKRPQMRLEDALQSKKALQAEPLSTIVISVKIVSPLADFIAEQG